MSRRREAVKREIIPDAKFNDRLITKFVNSMMVDGKKSTAQKILYQSLEMAGQRIDEEGITLFRKAVNNTKPSLEVRSKRVGGATYQIPVDVKANRRTALAIRWIIGAARKRGEKTMAKRLAGELVDAYRNEGNAIRKKLEQHRMADANRAFAHYRW